MSKTSYSKGNHPEFGVIYNGNFSGMEFTTDAGIDPGGDGGKPSTLMFHFEQMRNITIDKYESTVTMEWVGTQEFSEFHEAMALLVRELNATFGDPLVNQRINT